MAEADGSNFKFKNVAYGLYIPAVFTSSASNPVKLSEQGEPFVCTYDATAANWRFKNSSNDLYWDGNSDGTLSGWGPGQGQPVEVFSFTAAPLYEVHVTEIDPEGNTLADRTTSVVPGSEFLFAATWRTGLEIATITGAEGLDCVESDKNIVVTYVKKGSALDNVEAATDSAVKGIYDLQGRRLPAIGRPGVYIINGQKILVK